MARRRKSRYSRHAARGLVLGLVAFGIAIAVNAPSMAAMERLNLWLALPLLAVLVAVGVLGDLVGVAAAAASEPALHAMAAKRRPGARHALVLKRQADRVTSIASDIVGDIAGTISGAAGAAIAYRLVAAGLPAGPATAFTIGGVAALTVGGKAYVKGIALSYANEILYLVGLAWQWADWLVPRRRTGRPLPVPRRSRRPGGGRAGRGR